MVKRILNLLVSCILLFFLHIPLLSASEGEGGAPPYYNWLAIASGIAIGIAAFGGALGQANAVSSALKGIARNPEASGKITTPMIIGLALIESLVIYALLIAFFLQGKIR